MILHIPTSAETTITLLNAEVFDVLLIDNAIIAERDYDIERSKAWRLYKDNERIGSAYQENLEKNEFVVVIKR